MNRRDGFLDWLLLTRSGSVCCLIISAGAVFGLTVLFARLGWLS